MISTPLLSGPEVSPTTPQHRENNVRPHDIDRFWKPGYNDIPKLPPLSASIAGPSTPPAGARTPTFPIPPIASPSKPAPLAIESKSRYSVFPTRGSLRHLSWDTVSALSDEEIIELPAPLFAPRHHRDVSEESSQMVQIGLRISDAIDVRTDSRSSTHQPSPAPVKDLKGKRKVPLSRRQPSDESLVIPKMYLQPRLPTAVSVAPESTSIISSLGNEDKEKRQRRMMKSLPPIPPVSEEGLI